ncbi:MAG: FliM/FliN family flagellar motor switch protein [Phycisphaerae bacterium]|jgi:flagellar motor switch protein FliM|nr:FliM/FliN family flagellar motor switch protein [Phycisphaerae bacterium]
MAQTSQTRDDNSCNQPPPADGASAWKSFVGQMAGRFPTAMSQLLRGRGQLRGASVSQLQTGQFRGVLRALVYGRAYSWTVDTDEDEGRIWLGLDAHAAGSMIDVILGGRPYQSESGSRALTAIDRRLLGRVMDRAVGLVAGLVGIPQPLTRRQAEDVPESSAVQAVCFDLEIGGAMWLFVDDRFCADAASHANGRSPRAKGGPIELSATLNVEEIASDQLAALEVGDVISTDVSVEGEVIVRLAGIPKYVGQLSTVDGKKAITITRKITDAD